MVYMFPHDPCPDPKPKKPEPPVCPEPEPEVCKEPEPPVCPEPEPEVCKEPEPPVCPEPEPEVCKEPEPPVCPEPEPKKTYCPVPAPVQTQTYCPPPNLDPYAGNDCIEACSGEKSTLSVWPLLQNDYDRDSGYIEVKGVQPYSDHGAKIELIDSDCDGIYDTYCYDPTTSCELSNLCEGETLTDCFTYLISDGKGGYDTAIVFVTVYGSSKGGSHWENPTDPHIEQPPLSADYASEVDPSSILPEGQSFVAMDYTSKLGAAIWREDYDGDGKIDKIVYDPTQSAHLAMLKPGESTVDTVNYTLQDENGNTYSSTVEITIYGGDVPTTTTTSTNGTTNWTSSEFVNDVSSETQYLMGNSSSSQFVFSGSSSDYTWNTIDDAGQRLVVVWDKASETPDLLYDYASLKFDDMAVNLYEDMAG